MSMSEPSPEIRDIQPGNPETAISATADVTKLARSLAYKTQAMRLNTGESLSARHLTFKSSEILRT